MGGLLGEELFDVLGEGDAFLFGVGAGVDLGVEADGVGFAPDGFAARALAVATVQAAAFRPVHEVADVFA